MQEWHRAAQLAAITVLALVATVLAAWSVTRGDTGGDHDTNNTSGTETTPVVSQPRDTAPASLARAREVLLDPAPLNVLVLGDSTSDGREEWPAQWGRVLVEDRTVSTWLWDTDLEQFAAEPETLAGSGEPFAIWNLSHPGASPESGADHLDELDLTPDLVLLNYGHGGTADEVSSQLDTLLAAITDRWADVPTVLIIQNPVIGPTSQRYEATSVRLRDVWAPANAIPVIDVQSVFRLPDSLAAQLRKNGVDPNESGTVLWTRVVTRALTPGAIDQVE